MRKYNSSFKTAFLSEAGNKLKNNDYFGFVELDRYACYVIADGITEMRDAESARKAIEVVVNAFQEAPGMGKGRIRNYLRTANRELLKGESYEKMKASVTVVVTDYAKLRYGHAGNTRLRLYRGGRLFHSSGDMSLSRDMAREGKLSDDKIARHEERNNLHSYLGKEKLNPFVSRKIKLADGDILTLYTRGIWENVDEGELSDVFSEAGNEPAEECDKVEDLLLSRQPEDLDNYTFAAVYVDKVFRDPERRKKTKRIITVSVAVLLLALLAVLLVFLWRRDRAGKRGNMEQHFSNTETYMEDNNFIRAKEECGKALELARKLRDREAEKKYNAYLACLEAVIRADDSYAEGNYGEAKDAYLKAAVRDRYADNSSSAYIEKRLSQINDYEQVLDAISLGDSLAGHGSYEMAEEKYQEAKRLAASIYFDDGRKQALDALDKLYGEWGAVKEEQEEQARKKAEDETAAAELVRQGDGACAEGDYDGAMVFYLIALEKYTGMEDGVRIAALNRKIVALNEKQEEVGARMDEAKALEEQARMFEEENDPEQAKIQYQYAKAVYTELGKDNKANEIQGAIDILDSRLAQMDREAEKAAAGPDGGGNGENGSTEGTGTVSGNNS